MTGSLSRLAVVAVVIVVLAANAMVAFGFVRGTWAVGGSDSSCYAVMAEAMARGELQPSSALAAEAPWPDAATTFVPAGFVPSPVRAGASSPVCAPGLSALMAPAVALAGRDAVFAFSPIASGVIVLVAGLLAARMAGPLAAIVAALLVAASPVLLFQAVQPMNDAVTAALWLSALAIATSEGARRAEWAGLVVGLAILVRPNLAPLGAVVAWASAGADWRRWIRLSACALPALAVMLALNVALYGGMFSSGYGTPADLFGLANLRQNAANYGKSLVATETWFPLLALSAPLVLQGTSRRLAVVLLAAAAVTAVPYLVYRPFPEWWYLRFLLPAVVCLVTVASAAAVAMARQVRMGGLVPIVTVILAVMMVRTSEARDAFGLAALEGRYRLTGEAVREQLPADAMIVAVWQSGSVRFHAGREALMWDSLDPEWLDRAIAWLQARGRPVYFLLERREEADFRARFGDVSGFGGLDWPPRLDIDRQVRIYAAADRERFLAGERYATEFVRPPR